MFDPQTEYLRELAGRICIHMPEWDVGFVQSRSFRLNGADGRGIIFWAGVVRMDDVLTTRLEVSGIYDLQAYIRAEDKKRINVSVKKGAEAIAKDVQRRFLPKYEAVYAKALETHKEIMRSRDARTRLLSDLAEAFDWKIVEDKDGLIKRVEEDYGRSNVDAHYTSTVAAEHAADRRWEVDLTLKKLTVAQALRIAEVLREPAFPLEQMRLL